MAMLAEPRRKQKWTLNPRGKHWSEDSTKFGQKMLEKMGWSNGKGLGANLDGMTEHIRLRYKNDQAGIGFSHDDRDKQWTQHQEGFNELLQKLHNGETAETSTVENELSGKSLELKSKQSRARVHYQKFTRGKDVNKYSSKDLANIFGKKNLDDKAEEPEALQEIEVEIEEPPPEPVGSTDTSHGVMTIKGGSITDYFKNKMSHLGKKTVSDDKNESDSDTETRAGFGFSVKTEIDSPKIDKLTSRKNFGFVNPAPDLSSVKSETSANFAQTFVKPKIESPKESKETPRKRKNEFVFENQALDITSPKQEFETPRKRKSDYAFVNPCLELGSASSELDRTPKRRKSETGFVNCGVEIENLPQTASPLPASDKKKRKKKSKESSCSSEGFTKQALNLESSLNEAITAVSVDSSVGKERRKKKSRDCSFPSEGFTNEALSLELNQNEVVPSVSQFEVTRACLGLVNDALDLADETNGKKRVTFNETVEYDTDSAKAKKKKNKNSCKLDKFEVDNDKLKKKRKKSKKTELDSVFVNEAMDIEIISQEVSDNALNERKSERARRKRERRSLNLETIEEAPEEEKISSPEVVTLDESIVVEASVNMGDLSLDTPKKKKKKKKSKAGDEAEVQNALDTTIDISEEAEAVSSESTKVDKKLKKRKKREPEVVTIEETLQSSGKKCKKQRVPVVNGNSEKETELINLEETVVAKKQKASKNLSTVKSSVDKENVESTENIAVPKKSKKHRKSKNAMETEEIEQNLEETLAEDTMELPNGSQSPWDSKVRKSKKIFKTLFARSPVVHFTGSNINEIKGYGMN